MNIKYKIAAFFLLGMLFFGCDKKDLEYKKYLAGGEIIYPGCISNVKAYAGYEKVTLSWANSPDPNVVKYVIYWNNKADSLIVPSTGASTVQNTVVNNLNEKFSYSFTIYSLNSNGDRSIPVELNNAKAYGQIYQSGLLNRTFNPDDPYVVNDDGTVVIKFNDNTDTTNVVTVFKYITTADKEAEKILTAANSTLNINDIKFNTKPTFKSGYVPVGAIDTFYAMWDEFPEIKRYIECNKALFQELHLSGDANAATWGWAPDVTLKKIWDGDWSSNGQDFWSGHIFHSNGAHLPAQITFDLGKAYNELGRFTEMGRSCCATITAFEVWGINTTDINAAATSLPSSDAGWAAEMKSKGWTLLKDIVRSDNGQAAANFNLIKNPPPVRYIRIRVKALADGSTGDFQIAEVSFWNKQ